MLEQLSILAPGMLGASVARAARKRAVAKRIVLWARRPAARRALAAQPWCDAAEATPAAAVGGASLVVIAAPVDAIVPLMRKISTCLPAGAVVTDVGSVKGAICRRAHAALGARNAFVGAHPMAGSEKAGWEHGRANLFEGRTCFVTPLKGTDPRACRLVTGFWRDLGCRVVSADPGSHDRIVAHVSHLPQVLASALCAFLARKDRSWRDFAGGGLRDTTRIAASNPAIWRSILRQNRAEILGALKGLIGELEGFESALSKGRWRNVASRLERARAYRAGLRVA